jgi:hypothetical protein
MIDQFREAYEAGEMDTGEFQRIQALVRGKNANSVSSSGLRSLNSEDRSVSAGSPHGQQPESNCVIPLPETDNDPHTRQGPLNTDVPGVRDPESD